MIQLGTQQTHIELVVNKIVQEDLENELKNIQINANANVKPVEKLSENVNKISIYTTYIIYVNNYIIHENESQNRRPHPMR